MSQCILVTGARGTLGRAFVRELETRSRAHHACTRNELNICDENTVERILEHYKPRAVINAAGYVRVDDAELDAGACFRVNTSGAAVLARQCARHQAHFLTFSSDLVFDGARRRPYFEDDPPAPLSVYGRSKAEAERLVLDADPRALVIRTSAFFGPWDEYNFVSRALAALKAGEPWPAANDLIVSPTYVVDLVDAALELLDGGAFGIWHLANRGAISWAALARRIAKRAGISTSNVKARSAATMALRAPRPKYSALGSMRTRLMPSLEDALDRYFQHIESKRAA